MSSKISYVVVELLICQVLSYCHAIVCDLTDYVFTKIYRITGFIIVPNIVCII